MLAGQDRSSFSIAQLFPLRDEEEEEKFSELEKKKKKSKGVSETDVVARYRARSKEPARKAPSFSEEVC